MIYLKKFETKNDYLIYRNDKSKYLKPNVSLCDDNDKVHYNLNNNGHDYVDLGLPSGTLWATCNVGADKPSDYGLYFQWGDTQGYTLGQIGTVEGKKYFGWGDYKWNPSGDGKTFTKYDVAGATLELADDAAHVNMGGNWHMPSPEQISELLSNTTNTWTTSDDGVNGRLFTSKNNGKSIFIPAAGGAWDSSIHVVGDDGNVWSSVLSSSSVNFGRDLFFNSGRAYLGSNVRSYGFSVRGVLG